MGKWQPIETAPKKIEYRNDKSGYGPRWCLTSLGGVRTGVARFRHRPYDSRMPKGPRGEKRPADTVKAAILIAKIATGEVEDTKAATGVEANRKGGRKGGSARAKALTPERRTEIATRAAAKRWGKK